mmetsp:Transcript_23532/g.74074  ORF Transcript_23532/g.74074 Transcript_23532/m.74074 type:complete len:147 (+) Transcript_23532:590-1030(+)
MSLLCTPEAMAGTCLAVPKIVEATDANGFASIPCSGIGPKRIVSEFARGSAREVLLPIIDDIMPDIEVTELRSPTCGAAPRAGGATWCAGGCASVGSGGDRGHILAEHAGSAVRDEPDVLPIATKDRAQYDKQGKVGRGKSGLGCA